MIVTRVLNLRVCHEPLGPSYLWSTIVKETLNKCHFLTFRHSGESRNPVETIIYWMPVWLQTIHGLHPAGVLRTTRFVPDESVTGMTVNTLLQSFLKDFS
jgi:hypothetical protein